ncbi:DUF2202 domain-containing protein [Thiothrix lacustris]|uniref:DUF2202 domain-containing protein n=1 Tax=Thiothrix lacustris TaxID=525917 RepID=A0ABY9MM77_9GAMM|nr:DUF2202 domain-containing protein [Thiothrix lacustris]WML89653.1 DUF2202 domain-containing protein [Thiothrix lacustris]
MKIHKKTGSFLLACSLVLLTGCGSSSASTSLAETVATANMISDTSTITPIIVEQPLTVAETETLLFVREEEKLARDVYLTLYNQWGSNIFQNIANNGEQQHMDAIKVLVDAFGYVDPVSSNEVGAFTDAEILKLYNDLVARGMISSQEALMVGGFIEEYDIKDLQDAIDEAKQGTNQAAVIQTYDSLLCGSRNHLRSFVGQIEKDGLVYQAQYVSQATVDAIVNSPEEKCGQ